MRASTFAIVLLAATGARAAGEGEACTVTDDCDDAALHCIGGRCVSIARAKAEWHPKKVGDVAMFGDGRGYTRAIIWFDVGALAGTTAFLSVAGFVSTTSNTGWQVVALVPLELGPLVHATRERWVPALVSFLGWSSLGATIFATAVGTSTACVGCETSGAAVEVGLLALGGSLLTWLDAWMARDMRPVPRPRTSWFPTFTLTRDRALAGLAGAF